MTTFTYTAKNLAGKMVKDTIEASDLRQAVATLRQKQLFVLRMNQKKGFRLPSLHRRVNLFEKMTFTKQLSVMVKSGLPIVESLQALSTQTSNGYFRTILADVAKQVSSGTALAKALQAYRRVFGDVYVAMVAAGEKSGQLDKVLTRLGDSLERELELIGKIKGAFYYPIFILVVLFAVVVFLLIAVIPQLRKIFEESGTELPFITKALLAISSIFVNYLWLTLLAAVLIIILIRYSLKIAQVKHFWDIVQIKLPIFGKFFQKIYFERFSRTFSSLIGSGIPILEVMATTSQVVTNSVFQTELKAMQTLIERGQPISEAVRRQRHFPVIIANLLQVGEKTGNLAPVSEDLANFYARDIDQTAKNLSSLLEPIIMLIMGVGIGFVVAAVILPIYRLIGVAG